MVRKKVADMTTNEERLRTVAKEAFIMLRDVSYDQYEPEEVEEMMGKLETTITATAGRPEMDRLVEWLEEHANNEIPRIMRIRHRQPMPYTLPMRRGLLTAYRRVLHHIREMQEEQQ